MFENLVDLLRATEAAAIAASQWVGTGDKLNADKAATEAMRHRLNKIEFAAKILIGEGKKDESFGLFNGEFLGKRDKALDVKHYELAVDPIDGTRPTVTSGPEALSVLAIAEEGAMYTTEEFYMHKIAYGPEVASRTRLFLNDPLEKVIDALSRITGKERSNIVVCLLNRPRHEDFVKRFRKLGVRIKLIQDCDISAAIATCLPESGIDLMYGVGGAPEAVITAAAMKCLGGGFSAQIAKPDGSLIPEEKVRTIDQLVKGNCAFAATGITNGSLLKGVRFTSRGPVTSSVVMRSLSGTVRWVKAHHGN